MPRVRVVLSLGLPDPDRLSTTLLWSLLGHAGLLLGVLIWQSLPSRATVREAPYFVRLAAPAGLAGGGAASAAPVRPVVPIEEPAPAPKPAAPKPAAPKPPPKKASIPPLQTAKKSAPRPAARATEAASSASEGETDSSASGSPSPGGPAARGAPGNAPGGVGGTSFGEGDFQYDWYRAALEAKLRAGWRRPIASSPQAQVATVGFTIRRDGAVQDVAIATASGNELLDLSVVRAVYDAAPLPPLPRTWKSDSVHVTIEFQLTPGGA